MDGDLCIEKILDAFDREYERSKAEHIDYFLSERKSLEVYRQISIADIVEYNNCNNIYLYTNFIF